MKIISKPVKMVAVFDEQGFPTPIRFRIEEEGIPQTVKVDHVLSTKAIRPAGMDAFVFCCQSEIRGALKQYELVYRIKPHQWELYKI